MIDEIDYEVISLEFAARGWQWQTTEQVKFVPTKEDIRSAVETAIAKLDHDFDDGTDCQLNVGRLIIQRVEGFYDLYVFAGTHAEA
jgi:hypothetical protein